LEVVVVDDGSHDSTGALAETFAVKQVGFKVIRQPNLGHGGAINTGLAAARGQFAKVLDADDWFDRAALESLIEALEALAGEEPPVDVVVTNLRRETADQSLPTPAIRFARVLPGGRTFGWREVGRFRAREYMMLHCLTYRTGLLRETGLRLPEHSFYVDSLAAFTPLFQAERLRYLDLDLYHYLIGRPGQSVDEAVMLRRLDQQLAVCQTMMEALHAAPPLEPRQRRYLVHHLKLVCLVSSSLLLRSGRPEDLRRRREFWRDTRRLSPELHRRLRWSLLGTLANLPGPAGRRTSLIGYRWARRAAGFG
jgi:glycosyltransferase involved in cell wall biosynthesis